MQGKYRFLSIFLSILLTMLLNSCTRLEGWGLLLWATENPAVPSGTILPVYIKSNIDKVWVVGFPNESRIFGNAFQSSTSKFEVPLSKIELVGTKNAAQKRAAAFAELALIYAETLQDGLPIRDAPDNSSRRVYRLRQGEIVKILSQAEGTPALGSTGEPLTGAWYEVLTENGTVGYCYSYRLRFFEHTGGPLTIVRTIEEDDDPDLDRVLATIWYPESYGTMVNSKKLDLDELSKQWHFSPGQDTGIAHIYLPAVDRTFSYTRIRSDGARSWHFEGAPLQMQLRSDTTLAVQYTENGGALRTLLFVTLPRA
jgi:hypothetical protein